MKEKNNRENFKRLAVKRVSNVIKHIRLVGNLSNSSNYAYTKEDVEKIFREINKEVELCRMRFDAQRKKKSGVTFSLDD